MTGKTAIIVGAGWAGLSAATKLAESGIRVTLLEAAPQAGGRARKISFGQDTVDNGQHILIGAYQHCLSLLKTINLAETDIFHRVKNRLWLHDLQTNQCALDLQCSNIPAPFHLIKAILLEKNLPIRDKFLALRFCYFIKRSAFQIHQDVSVLKLLNNHHQSTLLIKTLWEPIALATLSTPISIASAQIFLNVLQDAFNNDSRNSDFLLAKTDLSTILPTPALTYLEKKNGNILYNHRVKRILVEYDKCVGVETLKGTILKGDIVILATPPHATANILLQSSIPSTSISHLLSNLKSFSYQSITTIYLRYPTAIQLPYPLIGIKNGISQWIFDRGLAQQKDILSVIITAPDNMLFNNTETHLLQRVIEEVTRIFPQLATPIQSKIITEKRAAFSCTVNIAKQRPSNSTPIPNLWLAGDYTNNGYPATLEGAIMSGLTASSLICCNQN